MTGFQLWMNSSITTHSGDQTIRGEKIYFLLTLKKQWRYKKYLAMERRSKNELQKRA